jgi:hypothetical protein
MSLGSKEDRTAMVAAVLWKSRKLLVLKGLNDVVLEDFASRCSINAVKLWLEEQERKNWDGFAVTLT